MTREKISKRLRFSVLARDGFCCQYCGRSGVILHIDHKIPQSRGGPTTIDNLVTSCLDCNLGKANKFIAEEVYCQEMSNGGCRKYATFVVGHAELGLYCACDDCAKFWSPDLRSPIAGRA